MAGTRTRLRDDLLSDRERELLLLAARGYTNREIADALSLSVLTVKATLRRAYIKLGAHSRYRSRLVRWARGPAWLGTCPTPYPTNRGSEKPIMIRSSATTMVRWTAKEWMDDADSGRIVPVPSQHAEHWVR